MAKVEIDLGTLTNSCFVIMPFSPTYQTEYERIIRPAVEAAGLECVTLRGMTLTSGWGT